MKFLKYKIPIVPYVCKETYYQVLFTNMYSAITKTKKAEFEQRTIVKMHIFQ